jgi:hypothetical protein
MQVVCTMPGLKLATSLNSAQKVFGAALSFLLPRFQSHPRSGKTETFPRGAGEKGIADADRPKSSVVRSSPQHSAKRPTDRSVDGLAFAFFLALILILSQMTPTLSGESSVVSSLTQTPGLFSHSLSFLSSSLLICKVYV